MPQESGIFSSSIKNKWLITPKELFQPVLGKEEKSRLPQFPKIETVKEKPKKTSFFWQFATDFAFTVLPFFLPQLGLPTLGFRILGAGRAAEAVASFLAATDKIKVFRLLKPFAEEFITSLSVFGGRKLVSQFTEKVEPVPLFDLYRDYLLGRFTIGGLGTGIKGTYQLLTKGAQGKLPKPPKEVDKAIKAAFKSLWGMSKEAYETLLKLCKGYQPQLLEAVVAQKWYSVLDNPEVKDELGRYISYVRNKIHKEIDQLNPKSLPNISQETLKNLSDQVYLRLLQDDNLHNVIVAAFGEKAGQPVTEFQAPAFRKLFWDEIKTDLKDLWEETKRKFTENAWNIVKSAIKRARTAVTSEKLEALKEKQLNRLAQSFLRRLYEMEGASKYRSGRLPILDYLFQPLLERYGDNLAELLTEGLKVQVDARKLKQIIKALDKSRGQSTFMFLESLGKYAYKYGTDFSGLIDRIKALYKADYRTLQELWITKHQPIVEEFFEQYIPRLGFKHPLRWIKEAKPTDILEPLDIDRLYSKGVYRFMTRYHPLSAIKPRFYNSIEDVLVAGIPRVIIRILKKNPNLITETEKLIETVAKEFGFTGGLTIPKWVANKFIVPQFIHNLYNHIDEVLKHPEIVAKLADPMTKKQTFGIFDKTVEMTPSMLDALKDFFMAITGRTAALWRTSKVYSINRLWKRIFLFFSPFFHASALSLSGLALANQYKIKGWDIVGRAYIDSLRVMSQGLSYPEFGVMAREVLKAINELSQKGFKIHEIILSGWNEGEALWGNYLATARNIMYELLQRGDQQALKEIAKDLESFGKKVTLDKIFNVFHAGERWLWAGYYQGLKLRTAYALVNAYRKGLMTAADLAQNLNTINYIYGGLHTWFYINPKMAQLYRLFLFAPDWYLSLFHNFRTWLHGDAPLVMNFFPTILRLRFYLAVNANYAFNGQSPWDKYDLKDPKEWMRLFLKDWTELFKIHVPIIDSKGHYRLFTFNLLGFDIEPLEMVGILPFTQNLYKALTHPTLSADRRVLQTIWGTFDEWLGYWFRKGSMLVRFFIKLYEATKPKMPTEREEVPTLSEVFWNLTQSFAPLAFVQSFGTIRYPYYAVPKSRNFMRIASFLNMFGLKTQVHEKLTEYMFENRFREKAVSEVLDQWLREYREIKEAQKEAGLISPKTQDVYKSLIVSLSHAYYNYYLYPWVEQNAHKDLKTLKREGREILELMKEDLEKSAFPDRMKRDIWARIKRTFDKELRDIYRAVGKRDLPFIIEKKIREEGK